MKSDDYKDLIVWQKSIDLVVEIYRLITKFPKAETYGLSDQLKRAAVSVPSNIAEGQSRKSEMEFYRFLCYARGSLAEVDTQLIIAQKVNYLT